MFERFTGRARQAVVMAQEEARRLRHNYIGTEHLLLGLLHETESVAANALGSVGISLEWARSRVSEIIGLGQTAPLAGHIPFTPRAKKVLELGLRESQTLGHTHIGTEHLLLGIVREGEGIAAQVLQERAELPRIRDATLQRLLGEKQHPPGIHLRRMTAEEWQAWRSKSAESYAQDEARAHGIPIEMAREHSENELAALLHGGLQTEGHMFLVAEDAETGERVGYVWFNPRTVEAGRVCWLYDVWVNEEVRGRGYGRSLMEALETEAKVAGLSRIELNVFGFNRRAINLYRSLGYTEMGRQMFKELGGA